MLTGLSEVWLTVVALGTLLLRDASVRHMEQRLLGRFIAVDVVKICCKDRAVARLPRKRGKEYPMPLVVKVKCSWACVKIGTEKETLS